MSIFKRYGFAALIAAAVLFPFVFYSSDLSRRRELSIIEKLVFTVTQPVQFAFSLGTYRLHNMINMYVNLHAAKEESAQLKFENAKLNVQMQMLKEVDLENVRLKKLLNFIQNVDIKFVSGQVQSADPSFLYKSVRLNRGESDGVEPGMSVVAAEGAVGVVMRANENSSDVLLITDPNSNLDVIVARNRRRGILDGSISSYMQFKYSDRGSRVQVGDEIVSSGLTGSFPRGIMVGRVARIRTEPDGVTQSIEVEPTVNFAEISEALILLRPSREVEVIRRIGGDQWMKKLVEGIPSRSGG